MSAFPFVIIDDDTNEDPALKNLVGRMFPSNPLVCFYDGFEAFQYIEKEAKTSVVISDINIKGINGLLLLKKIRSVEELKNVYFIFMNTLQQKEQSIQALQSGADEILNKPFTGEMIIARIRTAARIVALNMSIQSNYAIINDLKKELDEDADKTKNLLKKLFLSRSILEEKALNRIVSAAEWVCKHYNDIEKEEIRQIKIASELCSIGKMLLPDSMVHDPVMKSGNLAKELMGKVPQYAKELLADIRDYENVSDIIFHIYENHDGTGIPDKIQAGQIPIGSRIIRVALDFEELLLSNSNNPKKTMDLIYLENKRLYDYKVVSLFDQFLASIKLNLLGTKEKSIMPNELEEKMIVSRNVTSSSGMMLIASDTVLDIDKIDKIKEIHHADPIIGKIYIRDK